MNTQVITRASSEWAKRPDDERFVDLPSMSAHFHYVRDHSRALTTSTFKLHLKPEADNGLALYGSSEVGYQPTHYSFGQLATLAEAPARYLRTLPAAMSADCLNYGLQFKRDIEDVGLLLSNNGRNELRAATGPRYGRIWNSDVTDALIARFGDGVTGHFRVPGEFGKHVDVNKRNTTLYASDRDMFVFLCDEERRIEVAGRSLARGFFVWNSEVGSAVLGLGTFLFDFVCQNRMIWGSQDYKELRVRHTASAPDKFLADVTPALHRYAESDSHDIVKAVMEAKANRLSNVDEFLAKRYGPQQVASLKKVHELEEGKPIETRWDVVVAISAQAKSVEHQDRRVELERSAGALLS